MADVEDQQHPDAEAATDFEAFLWALMLRFVDVPADRVDEMIRDAQRQYCEALGLDRSTLWQTSASDRGALRVTHIYQADVDHEPVDPRTGTAVADNLAAFRLAGTRILLDAEAGEQFPWLTRRVFERVVTAVNTLDDLPPEASTDAANMRLIGTVSTVVVPLRADSGILGALSFASTRRQRTWTTTEIMRFELVADIFGRALARKQEDQRLQRALEDAKRLRDQLQHENRYLRSEIRGHTSTLQIVGNSTAILNALASVEQVAPTTSTVLLLGETGTGKERFAAAIHAQSQRSARAMVTVNCAAIPATLIESELFGREKGAYTGALTRQIGRFELANGSTIFLDEIGDLPLEIQTKLLRVIETRQFERLGNSAPVRVDVRIIAATNHDLELAVREGLFRKDLFYRLNVFPIQLPPLRDHLDDVPLLVKAIVDELGSTMGKRFDTIPRSSLQALQGYHWPGNIRELRNIIERAMITAEGPLLNIRPPDSRGSTPGAGAQTLVAIERDHVLAVLQEAGWRIRGERGAAAILGLPPTTLEHRMAKLGIIRPGKKHE